MTVASVSVKVGLSTVIPGHVPPAGRELTSTTDSAYVSDMGAVTMVTRSGNLEDFIMRNLGNVQFEHCITCFDQYYITAGHECVHEL